MILMASSDAWDMSASSFCYNSLVPRVSLERLVPVPRVSLILLQGEAGLPCNATLLLRLFTVCLALAQEEVVY